MVDLQKWSWTAKWHPRGEKTVRPTFLRLPVYEENLWVHLCPRSFAKNTMSAQCRSEKTTRFRSHVAILRANKLEKWSKSTARNGSFTLKESKEKKLTEPLSAWAFTQAKWRLSSWSLTKIARRSWRERTDQSWPRKGSTQRKRCKPCQQNKWIAEEMLPISSFYISNETQ